VSILFGVGLILSTAAAQWEPDVRLTNDTAASYLAAPNNHPIVANGDSVYAVFVDDRTGKLQVYFTRSLDDGTTWDSAVCLSHDGGDIFTPVLAVSGAAVHVAWPTSAEAAIMYRRSTDAGATWTDEDTLVASTGDLRDDCLAVEGNTVGLAWEDYSDGEVYLKRSSDGGLTWGPDTRLTFRADTVDKEPCLAIAGSFWHLAWTGMSWSNFHALAWYQRSTDGGASWLAPSQVTLDTTSQSQPSVAVVGSNVHVGWSDGRMGSSIFYHSSTDNGATWSPEQRLTDALFACDYPQVAAAGGNVCAAFRMLSAGHFFIDYCGSTDYGQTWSAETALTIADGMGTSGLAAAGSRAHLVLYDNRDGNHEIYYKRNLTAGGVEEERTTPYASRSTLYAGPTIVRGILELPGESDFPVAKSRGLETSPTFLLDISGRKAMDLHSGSNDVSRLAPGVYFLHSSPETRYSSIAKIVITK
jgi:hypothetical protein